MEEALVKLSLEADDNTNSAREIYERIKLSFYSYIGYRLEGSYGHRTQSTDRVMNSREAVYRGLQELENLAKRQLQEMSQPLDRGISSRRSKICRSKI